MAELDFEQIIKLGYQELGEGSPFVLSWVAKDQGLILETSFESSSTFDELSEGLIKEGWDLKFSYIQSDLNRDKRYGHSGRNVIFGGIDDELVDFLAARRTNASLAIFVRDEVMIALKCQGTRIQIQVAHRRGEKEEAQKILDSFCSNSSPIIVAADKLSVRFYTMHSSGSSTYVSRDIEAYEWDNAKANYPVKLVPQLEELMELDPSSLTPSSGKIILLYGRPGTGKTSFINVLAGRWREWCNLNFIVDTEVFFGNASYMMDTLLRQAQVDKKWNVFILEDAGEFIQKGASKTIQQSFSRLLNLSDGILGKGLKFMFIITTNYDKDKWNEALTRGGRCLADLEFDTLSAQEASEWLGEPVQEPTLLSDLYERKFHGRIGAGPTKAKKPTTGQYL